MKKLLFAVAMSTIFFTSCQKESITVDDSMTKSSDLTIYYSNGQTPSKVIMLYYTEAKLSNGLLYFVPNRLCANSIAICSTIQYKGVKSFTETNVTKLPCK